MSRRNKNKKWYTSDGREIAYGKMSVAHLINVAKRLSKCIDDNERLAKQIAEGLFRSNLVTSANRTKKDLERVTKALDRKKGFNLYK